MPQGYHRVGGEWVKNRPPGRKPGDWRNLQITRRHVVHPIVVAITERQNALRMPDEALAERAGVSTYTLQTWRQGRANPLLWMVTAVASVVGLQLTVGEAKQ